MFREGYEIFVQDIPEIKVNEESEVEIRDCQTYKTTRVKAIISGPKNELPGASPLWLRALVGHLLDPNPWKIKILKLLGEESERKVV